MADSRVGPRWTRPALSHSGRAATAAAAAAGGAKGAKKPASERIRRRPGRSAVGQARPVDLLPAARVHADTATTVAASTAAGAAGARAVDGKRALEPRQRALAPDAVVGRPAAGRVPSAAVPCRRSRRRGVRMRGSSRAGARRSAGSRLGIRGRLSGAGTGGGAAVDQHPSPLRARGVTSGGGRPEEKIPAALVWRESRLCPCMRGSVLT